jgi:type IV fimbrial biogenesis protein FimT
MHKSSGFTVIELIIVVVIVAILAVIAFPSYAFVIRSNRVAGQVNDLLTAVSYARNEAVTRGSRITLCASTDGATCDAAGTWRAGWIVFVDGGTAGELAGTDQLLRVWPAIATADTLTTTVPFVSFSKEGFSSANDLVWNFVPHGCRDDQRRELRLRGLGRAETAHGNCT